MMSQWHLNLWVLLGVAVWGLDCAQPLAAQVIPDNTLPATEQTQVSANPNFQIDGGARRGGNLFHSFQSFSVPTGGTAYFNNAADVQNIFSRITGGSISNIDGLIRANGAANLFLLNPNGILFGPNASLNIGGSFLATTANAISLDNGEFFSSDAAQPLPSQLLTVNPNALFFNQLKQEPIIVQSRFNQSRFNEMVFNQSSFNATGLHVPPGQNLLLVGGPIQLDSGEPFIPASPPGRPIMVFFYPRRQEVQPDGGWLMSPGSHVELGAVGGVGTVALSTASSNWQLTIPTGVPRADVSFSNGSGIYAVGPSGSIRVLAQNIDIKRSLLRSGIPSDSRLPDTQTGDIELSATGSITMSQSVLDNLLSGQGRTGSVNLSAGDRISLDLAGVYNRLPSTGVGNAGDINITTGSLSLTNGAQLYSSTSGQGNAGSVNINARDTVSFDRSNVDNNVERTGVGNAGGINITTGSLSFTNNAGLGSSTLGQGNGGSVNINARDTASFTNVGLGSSMLGQGNAGSLNINAGNTVSFDDSRVFNVVSPNNIGNAGVINITTGSLSLTNGASLYSFTLGQGNAGNVTINARDSVSLDGTSPDRQRSFSSSSIVTRVERTGVGQGGNVTITTGTLSLTNGGAVSTENRSGRGNAGRVTIQARDVQISGTAPSYTGLDGEVFDFPSGVSTSVRSGSVGNGGDVTITTGSLSVSDFGRINTTAQGQGNAGNIQIQASDTVSFDGGDATSTLLTTGVGRGGDIDITALKLSLFNNAQLSAATSGEGNAGNITVSADTVGLSSGGQLLTTTSSNGRAGNITVKTPNLQLSGASSGLFAETTSVGDAGNLTIQPRGNGQQVRVNLQDGAQISASTSSRGQGGTLTIAAPESITLTGNGSIITAETGGSGTGGNLNLATGTLNIQNQAQVTVSSSGTGSAGSLFVDANRIYLNNQGRIRADTTGGGGNINLRTPLLLLRNRSAITTNATGENIPGGNITINAPDGFIIAVPGENSDISANSRDFRGGRVAINAQNIFGLQYRRNVQTPQSDITATGANPQFNGTVQANTPDVDPSSGLVELPVDFVDRSGLIAQGCPADEGNSFTITGRGGIPPLPSDPLRSYNPLAADWVALEPQQARKTSTQQTNTANNPLTIDSGNSPHQIVEAQGWVVDKNGDVILVAQAPSANSHAPLPNPVSCHG